MSLQFNIYVMLNVLVSGHGIHSLGCFFLFYCAYLNNVCDSHLDIMRQHDCTRGLQHHLAPIHTGTLICDQFQQVFVVVSGSFQLFRKVFSLWVDIFSIVWSGLKGACSTLCTSSVVKELWRDGGFSAFSTERWESYVVFLGCQMLQYWWSLNLASLPMVNLKYVWTNVAVVLKDWNLW